MIRPTLADLEAFRAVATERSFRRAADLMGVSRSTLSHTLIELERKLGVRLLNRTTRSVAPTEAGRRLLAGLGPVLGDLDAVLDGLSDDAGTTRGTLRINAGRESGQYLLDRVVPHFLERFPAVDLDLLVDGRLVDIVEEGFDAGIRLAEAVPQDMVAVRASPPTRFLAVASPAYLKTRPRPAVPDDLKAHDCIRQRLPGGKRYRWEFARGATEIAVDVPGRLTLNNSDLALSAALSGLGIAFLAENFIEGHLRDGSLVAVLEDWCPKIDGLMLYYPGFRLVPAPLRAFIDVLKEKARAG